MAEVPENDNVLDVSVELVNVVADVNLTTSPLIRSNKKRKRQLLISPSQNTQLHKSAKIVDDFDEDDGCTCSICLEQWDMCGEHRLTSLKCGHLFGHSCIKRWLQECVTGSKCCPNCKAKATTRDLRFLYAKRLCAVDNTENIELRSQLEFKTAELTKTEAEKNLLDFELKHQIGRLKQLQEENEFLRLRLASGSQGGHAIVADRDNSSVLLKNFKLFLEKPIEISKEPGCRCLAYAKWQNKLFISQKSTTNLFAGFGIRYVDLLSMRPTSYLPISPKQIMDVAVTDVVGSVDNSLLAVSMEQTGRLYDLKSCVLAQSFRPDQREVLWSCAYDKIEPNFLYFGSGQGTVYLYDKRNAGNHLKDFKMTSDFGPVINIATIPQMPGVLPFGGILVCKLKAIMFYEYLSEYSTDTKLVSVNIDGPFSSMSFEMATKLVLITTRSSRNHPSCRYILAEFVRVGEIVNLVVKQTFQGSEVMPVKSKPAQYLLGNSDQVIVTAYLQNTRQMTSWALGNDSRIQSLPVSETVLDLTPVHLGQSSYLAALSDMKCRIFKIHHGN